MGTEGTAAAAAAPAACEVSAERLPLLHDAQITPPNSLTLCFRRLRERSAPFTSQRGLALARQPRRGSIEHPTADQQHCKQRQRDPDHAASVSGRLNKRSTERAGVPDCDPHWNSVQKIANWEPKECGMMQADAAMRSAPAPAEAADGCSSQGCSSLCSSAHTTVSGQQTNLRSLTYVMDTAQPLGPPLSPALHRCGRALRLVTG